MNIAIAVSTARMGGSVGNYVEVLDIHKTTDANGSTVKPCYNATIISTG
jgi:hypothetical protein